MDKRKFEQSGHPWAKKGWPEHHSYLTSFTVGWLEATEHVEV